MSDVGDAIELTFESGPGAVVTMSWVDPAGVVVIDEQVVPETPPGSGLYPVVLIGSSPGIWQARYTAVGSSVGKETFYQDFDNPTGPSPYATVGDYEEIYGSLTAVREAVCNHLLKRASQMIRDRYTSVDSRIAAGRLPANSVAIAVMNMVARVMRNPTGLRSQSVGPFSRGWDTEIANGLLEFTAAETTLLLPTGSAGSGRVPIGTIRLRPGLAPPPAGWRRW